MLRIDFKQVKKANIKKSSLVSIRSCIHTTINVINSSSSNSLILINVDNTNVDNTNVDNTIGDTIGDTIGVIE